jgi:hypothetical protein
MSGVVKRSERVSMLDVAAAARAQVQLLGAWWLVRTRPRGTLVASRPAALPVTAVPDVPPDTIALGVDRAARWGVFRPTCLVRAIALRALLERAGVGPADVRVGVRWQDGRFEAHAWVEVRNRPVGRDGRAAHLFQVVDDIEILES